MDLISTLRKEGSRGGRANFKWDDVKDDHHRENYLGHSLMAPVGRWQKSRDLSWYAKGDADADQTAAQRERAEEIRRIKEAEQDALSAALGFPVERRSVGTGANGISVKEVQKVVEETSGVVGGAGGEDELGEADGVVGRGVGFDRRRINAGQASTGRERGMPGGDMETAAAGLTGRADRKTIQGEEEERGKRTDDDRERRREKKRHRRRDQVHERASREERHGERRRNRSRSRSQSRERYSTRLRDEDRRRKHRSRSRRRSRDRDQADRHGYAPIDRRGDGEGGQDYYDNRRASRTRSRSRSKLQSAGHQRRDSRDDNRRGEMRRRDTFSRSRSPSGPGRERERRRHREEDMVRRGNRNGDYDHYHHREDHPRG